MIRTAICAAAASVLLLTGLGQAEARECTAASPCVLKLATVAPKGTPWANLLYRYRSKVKKASGGRIKIKIYLGGTMGDENATVRMVARGRIQGVGASTGAIASLVPELSAVEVPFVFRTEKEADYVLDKYLTKPMEKLFHKRGMVLAFWSENGFRQFGTRSGAVKVPSNLRGKKMRSQENYVHLRMWRALKASPQAIPTTEVLTALKTKAVDGFDQSLLMAIAASWHKTISHLTLSNHIYQPAAIAFNKDWFNSLPSDLQRILIKEGRGIVRLGRRAIRRINTDLLCIFKSEKVHIHRLTASQRAKFEKATNKVRGEFRANGKGQSARILGLVLKGVKEYRKKYGTASMPAWQKKKLDCK
jgi:TRAP-type C4-dicarboxylate transport system substrate-binding protein